LKDRRQNTHLHVCLPFSSSNFHTNFHKPLGPASKSSGATTNCLQCAAVGTFCGLGGVSCRLAPLRLPGSNRNSGNYGPQTVISKPVMPTLENTGSTAQILIQLLYNNNNNNNNNKNNNN
jgi:hypothetical protein